MQRSPSRPSVRIRLAYLALLTAGVALLAGGWFAARPAGRASRDARYVEGVIGEPAHINPLLAPREGVEQDLVRLVFAGLTRIGPDGTPLPDLAASWDITADGRTYTFHLRPGLFWYDGEPLTAEDVAFTIEQVQAPGFVGSAALVAGWAGVRALPVDARTLILHLPAPSGSFLVQASLGILPAHLWGDVDPSRLAAAELNRAPVGAGPYRLETLSGRAAVLRANPGYHAGAPEIEELELRFFPSRAALADALADGAIDGALLPREDSATAAALIASDASRRAVPLPVGGYTLLYLNNRRSPLDEAALRRAIANAIDRDALVEVAGGGAPGEGPVVPGSWAYTRLSLPAPEEAAAGFETAGWTAGADGRLRRDGRTLQLQLVTNVDPTREALAAAIAEQLRAAGVEIEVLAEPLATLIRDRVEGRDFDLLLFAWEQGPDPDPFGAWHTSQIAAGGRNIAGFSDPAGDALIETARASVDVGERRELYADFFDRFAELAPAAILLYPERTYVVPRRLAGIEDGVLFSSADRFRNVHRWTLDGPSGGDAD